MTDTKDVEVIKTYSGSDIGASQCLVTLETFIGDVDGKDIGTASDDGNGGETFFDEGTIDTGDAVTAINGLIWSLERREAEIAQLSREKEELARTNEALHRELDDMTERCRTAEQRVRASYANPDWQFVPKEPTIEMIKSMAPLMNGPPTYRWEWIWTTLLTALASPASSPSPREEERERCARKE